MLQNDYISTYSGKGGYLSFFGVTSRIHAKNVISMFRRVVYTFTARLSGMKYFIPVSFYEITASCTIRLGLFISWLVDQLLIIKKAWGAQGKIESFC